MSPNASEIRCRPSLPFEVFVWCGVLLSLCVTVAGAAEADQGTQQVIEDRPTLLWTFEDAAKPWRSAGEADLAAAPRGAIAAVKSDLAAPLYPRFQASNRACRLSGGYLVLEDNDPRLDFANGDEITLESHVLLEQAGDGRHIYLIGKGRTNNAGFARDNQNYALRLTGAGGASAYLSFLFRSQGGDGSGPQFHRWTSKQAFPLDGVWRHVAVSYRFGDPKSIRGYVDGKPVKGVWDMGGETTAQPVVDDDQLWIGSSIGGNRNVTLLGWIDNVAIHRRVIPAERMANRYEAVTPPEFDWRLAKESISSDEVRAEIFEKVAPGAWTRLRPVADRSYSLSAMAAHRVPKKYDHRGLLADRSNPFRLRLLMVRELAGGDYRFLVRGKNATRFWIDDDQLAELSFMKRNGSGHEAVPDLLDSNPNEHAAPAGHQEKVVHRKLPPGRYLFRLETIVGGKGLRSELGELVAAMAAGDEPLRILAPQSELGFSEVDWIAYTEQLDQRLMQLDQQRRAELGAAQAEYWKERHRFAAQYVESLPAIEPTELPAAESLPANNRIDQFINAKLALRKRQPSSLTDDSAFLRRVTLDVVGRNPTQQEREQFLADPPAVRRANAIDRLLQSPEWADNWTGYWQDVLAENPGILKPKLNNTGPFRWWIHESLLDNKPLDRFVTELIAMRGSKYGGGPAGFAMATQNDVPMAAKAHVITQAFLGMEMKCARCHDAPFHPFAQKQLFGIASMLKQSPIVLPKTSTVPGEEGSHESLITVSLKPGDRIHAEWPFQELLDAEAVDRVVRDQNDTRERLAAAITNPGNRRFAKVLANRFWGRLLGWGIVDPVDDWSDAEPSHPKLLDYLGRELTRSGYDAKHLCRLILNSQAYQRVATEDGSQERSAEHRDFASPARRRLTAEQVVDTLMAASGKRLSDEMLTLDQEGRRGVDTFLNLGVPRRGWQLTSLSNERDRPALALPTAQSITDVLIAFGWRDSRPNPLTTRDQTPTILQPLTLANGVLGSRATRLSDNSRFTELALAAETPDAFVEDVFWELLSRAPSSDEREPLAELLRSGFDQRKTGEPKQPPRRLRNAVSWSNHLHADATRIKHELERLVRQGDPPSPRLQSDWRQRAEDVVWAVANSPEFVFVP